MEARRVPGEGIDLTVIALEATPPSGTDRIVDPVSLARRWRAAYDAGVRFVEGLWLAPVQEGLQSTLGRDSGRLPTGVATGIDGLSNVRDPADGPPAPDAPRRLRLLRRPSRATLDEILRKPSRGTAEAPEASEVFGACWPTVAEAAVWVPDAVARGVRILAFPVNLLEYRRARPLCERAHEGNAGVIALDPFAGGLLDGSFLEEPAGLTPTFRPESFEGIARRLAPVADLGFLTAGRRRTLVEAALRGILDLPAVLSVSVSFRSPRIEAAVRRLEQVPSFSRTETEHLGTLRRFEN